MSKKIVSKKVHKVLTSEDKEALFWVTTMCLSYFAFISICWIGGH